MRNFLLITNRYRFHGCYAWLSISLWLSICSLLFSPGLTQADEIHIASASNFSETLKEISRRFEMQTGHKVIIISGSTGKLYAQIKNGAPFDAFFSADAKRAELLDKEEIALPDTLFTYAIGKLVLWSPKENLIDQEALVLKKMQFRHLAIANPKLAPYGRAAMETLKELGLWNKLHTRMVRGENIGQTFQFVKSANVPLGLIAYSQIKRPGQSIKGSFWLIPQSFYSPIEQRAVQLKNNQTVSLFLAFIKKEESLQLIHSYGYEVKGSKIKKQEIDSAQ